jgi:hypothetical protein
MTDTNTANTSTPTTPNACPAPVPSEGVDAINALVSMVTIGACVFHGYKRNNGSVGWAVAWGLFGATVPVVPPVLALLEGFGKPIQVTCAAPAPAT